MSRHALRPAHAGRRRIRTVLSGVLVLLLVGALMIKIGAVPHGLRTIAAKSPLIGAQCPSTRLTTTTIDITVAPELQSLVGSVLAPLQNKTLPNHECVKVSLQSQAPAETVEGAQILPIDRAPDIWIPDSSLWVSRVPRWQVNRSGSFASSPVVIASNRAAFDQLGWTKKAPTWAAALAGTRPLAVPEIATDAAGLSAVIALWQSLGKAAAAQEALAGTVLAAGRAGVPTQQQAIEAAQSGAASAPLLPTSERAVGVANLVAPNRAKLVSVRPTGGSPALDYPVLTTARRSLDLTADPDGGTAATRQRAVRAVVAQLLGGRAAKLVRAAGFEVASRSEPAVATSAPVSLSPPGAAGPAPAVAPSGSPVEGLSPAELAALVDRITLLSAPSRVLVIFDLSKSMASPAANGQSRIRFAASAARLAGNFMTDKAQVGLWGFARDLVGKKAIVKIESVAPLGNRDGSRSHRDRVNADLAGAAKRLGGNGTALYSTAVAGMEAMKALYDPRAGNAVVLFTDGANFDPGGPSLKQTLPRLKQLYDPQKPVRLICIGIGAGADMSELRALSGQAGGQAFAATNPKQLPGVLFQVMNQRKH